MPVSDPLNIFPGLRAPARSGQHVVPPRQRLRQRRRRCIVPLPHAEESWANIDHIHASRRAAAPAPACVNRPPCTAHEVVVVLARSAYTADGRGPPLPAGKAHPTQRRRDPAGSGSQRIAATRSSVWTRGGAEIVSSKRHTATCQEWGRPGGADPRSEP